MAVSVMKKLTALAVSTDADRLVRRLLRPGCVQLCTVPLSELPDGGKMVRHDAEVAVTEAEQGVNNVTEALEILDAYRTRPKPWARKPHVITAEDFRASGRYEAARNMAREAVELKKRQVAARAESDRLLALCHTLTPWQTYDVPLSTEETARTRLWLGTLPATVRETDLTTRIAGSFPEGESAREDLHMVVREVPTPDGGKTARHEVPRRYVSVIFLKEETDEVSIALAEFGFVRLTFRDLPLPNEDAAANLRAARRRLAELENELQLIRDRLSALTAHMEDLEILSDMAHTALTAARLRGRLAATEHCVLLEGWVPEDREARVAAMLDRLTCAYDFAPPAPNEEPPVLLRNNSFAANFEWVVGMYAYPKYGTYDPTFIMSIFYFFIFGIMFADVGYGALLLLGGFLLPRLLHIKGNLARMLNMFGYCGISCVLLGLVFGGWFGDLPYALMTNFGPFESVEAAKEAFPLFNGLVVALGGREISLNPLENPMAFLVISLCVGGVHLIAGMAVKFVLLCRRGEVFAAIFDVGSYWVLFAGIGVLFLNGTVGLALTILGALMIVCTYGRASKNPVMKVLMGFKGLYDLISYASDLLSYCRILALGLAAGVVGQVINLLATMMGPSPAGFIVLVLVLLLGHTLNLAINLLGSFVHTSRLQYLEFFGKFYEDGGVPFDPARPTEKYSTAESEPDEAETSATRRPLPQTPLKSYFKGELS